MSLEMHERARKLLACLRVEGISAAEQRWLEAHLAGCRECSDEASALNAAIASLRALNFRVDVDTVRRTSLAVRRRAEQLHGDREHAGPLCIAAAMSGLWMTLTTPCAWLAFAWLGRLFHVSDIFWQLGFVMWWFLPATVLAGAAAWQHVARGKFVRDGITENWERI